MKLLKDERGRFVGGRKSINTIFHSLTAALFDSGLRTDEIADRLGCKEAAVANSLHRWREFRRLESAA
jgi:hypothetical protein